MLWQVDSWTCLSLKNHSQLLQLTQPIKAASLPLAQCFMNSMWFPWLC